jgi:DNA-directed RNA polymerase specialized sigma24 family protein
VYPAVTLSPHAQRLLSQQGTPVSLSAMPLAYRALREDSQHAWRRYAEARLRDAQAAKEAVDEAFCNLALIWSEALFSDRLAALAWHLLGRAVSRRESRPGCEAASRPPVADAELLHCRLGLPIETTAALMGTEPPTVHALLSSPKNRRPS